MTSECRYCGRGEKHDKRVCRMRALHADPKFAKANAERSAERMREVWRKSKSV